eukprot:jgi/Phyca11/22101/fgenesh1_pg.PHYCAscaffold_689_\
MTSRSSSSALQVFAVEGVARSILFYLDLPSFAAILMNHKDDELWKEFLAPYDAPEGVIETHGRTPTSFDDGLLLASDQLLAETEELLASYRSPINTEEYANSSSSTANSSEETKLD